MTGWPRATPTPEQEIQVTVAEWDPRTPNDTA